MTAFPFISYWNNMMRKLLSLSVILMLIFQSWWSFALEWEDLEVDNSWAMETFPNQWESALEEQFPWESLLENENWPEEGWSEFFSWKNTVDNTIDLMESLDWEGVIWQASSIKRWNEENPPFEEETIPKLIITEVFPWWRSEWIEITNVGNEDFSGELTIDYGTKKPKKITETLEVGKSLIIGYDKTLLTGNLFFVSTGFQLINNDIVDIKLKLKDEILDTFPLSKASLQERNKKTSFEKREENWSFTIVPTTQARTRNMQVGYFWNPWRAFDFDAWEAGEQESEEEIIPPSWNEAKLIVTEAFFHKTNNWIEISNIGDANYSGIIQLNGANKDHQIFEYTLSIPAKTTLVLTEEDLYFTGEFTKIVTESPYSLDRDNGLHLILTYWSGEYDEMIVHPEWTQFLKGKDSSFEKIFLNGQWLTTRTTLDRIRNMKVAAGGNRLIANPWMYFTEAENAKDISQPKIQQEESHGDEESPVDCANFTDRHRLEVQELFFWNIVYQPFIELKRVDTPWKISHLRLTGTLLEKELVIEKNEDTKDLRDKNLTFVLWNSEFWNDKGIDSIINPDFTFQNQSWYLMLEGLVGQERQVLDIIKLTQTKSGKSAYHQWNSQWCTRMFDQVSDFSPWFDKKFLDFFQIDSEPKIEYIKIWGGGGSCSCRTQEDLCPAKKDNKKEITETKVLENKDKGKENKKETAPTLDLENYQVKIEHIDYDPPGRDKDRESITMILTQGESLDLSLLTLNINGKNKKIKGILEQGVSQTFVGNFWFPNSSKTSDTILVQLKYKDKVLDSYYYKLNSKEKVKKEQISKEGIKVFSVLDGDTIRYRDENWSLQSVRLLGVDAPESNTARYKKTECYGKEAKDYLTQRLKGQYVQLSFEEEQASTDRYGRLLAYVSLDGALINEELIAKGYAREYTYKQDYTQQENFKKAEQQAQSNQLGMRNQNHCPNLLKQEEESKQSIENLIIKIKAIDYDPKGSDKDNESITLSLFDKSGSGKFIDFWNQFWLFVFDHVGTGLELNFEEIEGSGKFKDLSFLGQQEIKNPLVLKWDFGLPNTKSSCITLVQKEHLFDIACYDIAKKEEKKTESTFLSGFELKILSLTPNPKGKDTGKEKIELVFSPENEEQERLF